MRTSPAIVRPSSVTPDDDIVTPSVREIVPLLMVAFCTPDRPPVPRGPLEPMSIEPPTRSSVPPSVRVPPLREKPVRKLDGVQLPVSVVVPPAILSVELPLDGPIDWPVPYMYSVVLPRLNVLPGACVRPLYTLK